MSTFFVYIEVSWQLLNGLAGIAQIPNVSCLTPLFKVLFGILSFLTDSRDVIGNKPERDKTKVSGWTGTGIFVVHSWCLNP